MKLNEQTAMDVIKSPRSKSDIQAIKNHESQLRVFTEEMDEHELNREWYWTHLKSIMKKRSEKKFSRVMEFARYPLPVVQLSDSILNDFFKVFEGKNRYFSVDAQRDTERLDIWIRENKPVQWIEKQARKVFKNKPCSFLVVDRDENGNPYLINVGCDRLVDYKLKDDEGNAEYIAFIHSQKEHETKENVTTTFFSVYDDESYFVFSKDSDSDAYTKISESKHNIGWCPAKMFIRTISSQENKLKRRVAFSTALPKLEDWTIFDIFRNYVDHYAPFPVTEAPKEKCGNHECVNGKISDEVVIDQEHGQTKTVWTTCPVCEGNAGGQNVGPGTHIAIDVASDSSEKDGSGVFKMIFPDTSALKYTPDKLDDLELEVRFKTVGINTLMSNEAFNELQVKGSFSSMESILLRTKKELDDIYRFAIKTVGRLFYPNIELTVDANFGTEFYLVSEDDLQKRFDNAKKIGLPTEEMLNIYRQLVETKYKGNPDKRDRTLMLLDLDPYPMNTVNEVINMKREQLIDDAVLSLKINFLKFISKFEAENAPITQFGNQLEYWERIKIIEDELMKYNSEWMAKLKPAEPQNPDPNDPKNQGAKV